MKERLSAAGEGEARRLEGNNQGCRVLVNIIMLSKLLVI